MGRILRNFVAGEYVASGRTWDKIGPVDGAVIVWAHGTDDGLADRAASTFAGPSATGAGIAVQQVPHPHLRIEIQAVAHFADREMNALGRKGVGG
jgi:hypothetical protein